jgi:single-stranded DNA-binding protein
MRMFKANHVIIAGNIANVRIMTGQHGQYGSISIAVDDGYFKKGENGQDGAWVDRTHFVDVNVNANFLKKLKAEPATGDMISVEGKLTLDKWKDKTTQQERSALKVTASDVIGYVPKVGVVAMKAACGNNHSNQNGGSGGYQQQNGSQGGYQQQNGSQGGYQQQNGSQGGSQGGYQQQNGSQGGYQQQNQNSNANQGGGYQQNNGH